MYYTCSVFRIKTSFRNKLSLIMEPLDIPQYFLSIVRQNPELSAAVAAIKTLLKVIKCEPAETLVGLRDNLTKATASIKQTDSSITSVSSACELFLRFITLTSMEPRDFQVCKQTLIERGEVFLLKIQSSREKIAKLCHPFIQDGSVILTHSRSRVVLQTLIQAARAKKRFKVFVTESCPDKSGYQMRDSLNSEDIPCTVILDSAVGYIMEKVNFVMVGAEGVVESGGIINKIGSYTTAVCAQMSNKPFYVLAESFKFARMYPLNQQDVPNHFKYPASILSKGDTTKEHPKVDYTPPSYITLLFTDLGILTPSAVSDQLINLYL
uniref:Translation initiation factor eIF2B subunit alpha n=1 Tax=Strigamia maritima TaxID=126957 RepID=T1J6K5_STRMM